MSEILIHCKYDELIGPNKLKNHPKNPNKHGDDQIERLAEIYKHNGIRHPIIVSKLSGFVVAGHGRKLAAIRAGIKKFPVVYQEFESAAQEYQFMTSDNAIALWSDLDLDEIQKVIDEMPDINVEALGVLDFNPGEVETETTTKSKTKNTSGEVDLTDYEEFDCKCPKCGFEFNQG